jgi:histidinol phosphatase-like enzyme (inositol monophosphatase family)
MKPKFYEFTDFVSTTTTITSKLIQDSFDSDNLNVSKKADGSLLTVSDLSVEKIIRNKIKKTFPDHGCIGEELQDVRIDSEYCWIIDPIDGTFNFVKGVPFFGTLIGLLENKIPMYGSLRLPMTENLLLTGDNRNAYINGTSLKTTKFEGWSKSLILTTDINRLKLSAFKKQFEKLETLNTTFRTWGDCFGYYLLCIGKADVMIDIDLKPFDILPLIPILKGAGVEIIDLSPDKNYSSIVACKPEIKYELASIFG